MAAPSGSILLVATRLDPPVDGRSWAFHMVNDSTEPIESSVVEFVDYEWGEQGSRTSPGTRHGPIPPGSSVEVWRDDDDAAEVRMSLTLRVRGAGGERRILGEFGRLDRNKQLTPVPILGTEGVVATLSAGPLPG